MKPSRIWSMVLGGYPRSRRARHALRDYERGAIAYGEAEERVIEAGLIVIGVQLASGNLYIVDGMVDWHDPFRPFVEAWRNAYPDGLLRYFDNNFFYRIPVFTDDPEPSRLVLAPRVLRFRELVEPAQLKVVVPGPVTFALMSRREADMSVEELAESIARILSMEVREAVKAGASLVQIDEPMLTDPEASRDQAVLAAELASRIASEAGARSALALYFDVPKPEVYEALLDSKVDMLILDVADAPTRALELLKSKGFGGHTPGLGLINARQIYDDRYSLVASALKELIGSIDSEELAVTTTTWLDLIPFRYSIRKTYLLGLYTERLAAELGLEHVTPLRPAG